MSNGDPRPDVHGEASVDRGRGSVVGILGSARIAPGDPRHAAAILVGRGLAEAGYIVMTGGYAGLMEAVSRGAAQAGGQVIGLPVRAWQGLEPNAWLTETRWVDSFFDRLTAFARCDALVAVDGGLGTLGEAAVAWANLQTDPATNPPLVLFGSAWERFHEVIGEVLVVDERDLSLVRLVDRPEAVADVVRAAIGSKAAQGRALG